MIDTYDRDGWTTQTDTLRLYGTYDGHAKIERQIMAEWGGSHIAKTITTMLSKADAVRLGLVGEIDVADLTDAQRKWIDLETAGDLRVEQ